ncbi:Cof-type HAD-IIB family hydrolase [Beduini massiliensis]|uniref:Cof-type HAD-IIB family hydrolase n=1 Tax=Beduini massiliensis TaxID=1585974 RepID=UPI00059AB207|nr:Cof-type HAD-IIB family hydrolase [Beduini massiliensis]
MQEILFFDVDGTLLDSQFHMTKSTKKALIKLKQSGHLLCIATGRSYDSLLRTHLTEIINWDGIICNNGQLVLDQNRQILFKALIPRKSVNAFLKMASQKNYPVVVKCKERFISQAADENTVSVHQHFNNPIPPVGIFDQQEVEAMNIYAPKSEDYQDFSHIEDIDIIPCALNYAEISPKGVSKASSIEYLLRHYGHTSYIAFGDSPNDIKMLQHAKTAVVMGQSIEDVKRCATIVTHPIGQDGIMAACLQLQLFKEEI